MYVFVNLNTGFAIQEGREKERISKAMKNGSYTPEMEQGYYKEQMVPQGPYPRN